MSHEKILHIVECINLPKTVCNHLAGENHTLGHRLIVGTVVMFAGGMIAHFGPILLHGSHGFVGGMLHVAVDVFGYGIHGLGLVPYAEYVLAGVAVAE
jgi:hypothetical protein